MLSRVAKIEVFARSLSPALGALALAPALLVQCTFWPAPPAFHVLLRSVLYPTPALLCLSSSLILCDHHPCICSTLNEAASAWEKKQGVPPDKA